MVGKGGTEGSIYAQHAMMPDAMSELNRLSTSGVRAPKKASSDLRCAGCKHPQQK